MAVAAGRAAVIMGPMIDGNQRWPPGTTFQARMHWRLDEALDLRAWAGFTVEVRWIDNDDQRFLCRLLNLDYLSTSHPPEMADPALLARIRELPGLHAFLPFEAAMGRTLFLKPGTLTGRNIYFFDETSAKFPRLT